MPQGHFERPYKLHLGCGEMYLPGWVNIDSDLSVRVDVNADLRRVGALFEPDSVDEILMVHSISYLRYWEALDLFRDFLVLLRSGGRLTLEFPDAAKCAKRMLETTDVLPEYIEGIRGLYAFDMSEIENKKEYLGYKFGWSAWHIEYELKKVGFSDVRCLPPETHGPRLWRDTRIEAQK